MWFTASREDLTTWALRAVSADGKERVILPSVSNYLSIHDVDSNGRMLLEPCLPVGMLVPLAR